MKKRPLLLACVCLCLVLLGVRRALTVVTNLGIIRHWQMYPHPNPGDQAMAKSFAAMVKQQRVARLFVVRWQFLSVDWGYFVEAQYDRPSGQLHIWSEGASGRKADGNWRLVSQYRNVTDRQFEAMARSGGSIRDLPKYGATRVPFSIPVK
jgi:hypothetical protein